jgi:carboxylesterase
MVEQNCWVQQDDPSPFLYHGNGDTGVLLLHGFGGTPREMSRVGRYLHARNTTVYAPLLPGHGTSLAEINKCTWHDWTAATQTAFLQLKETCNNVFIAGFSMGSFLALWQAIQTKQNVHLSGLILYSPALMVADWRIVLTPVMRFFIKSISKKGTSDLRDSTANVLLGGYDRYPVGAAAEIYKLQRYVRSHLQHITAPTCVIYSVLDQSIHPRSGQYTVQQLSRVVPVEAMVLYGSGHAIVVDQEWEQVAEQTYKFIRHEMINNTPS